jgi:hypothetical protein
VRRLLPHRLLDGPPPSLPHPLDRLSERWWGLPPRARAVAWILTAALVATILLMDLGRAPHGPLVPVAVAARDLPAGHALGPGDLEERPWPRDLVPPGAGVEVAGTLRGPVPEGTPLGPTMVTDGGVAAMVADGFAAVSLAASLMPPESLGARLDLVASTPHGTRVLTRAARVLTADEHHVWVEVRAGDAAEVASAARGDALVAVVHAPGGPP